MDYKTLITSEHQGQPKFMAWLTAAVGMIEDVQKFLGGLYLQYDLDRAAGVQLDSIGTSLGMPRKLPWQPSNFYSIPVTGATVQDGTGDPSPDNVRSIHGTDVLTVSDGGSNSQTVTLPQALYSLPDGTADNYEAVSGQGTQNVGKIVLTGAEAWTSFSLTSVRAWANVKITGMKYPASNDIANNAACDKFPVKSGNYVWANVSCIGISSSSLVLSLPPTITTLADFKAWLAANPVTVFYALATPTAITSTPAVLPRYQPKTFVYRDDGALVGTYIFSPILEDSYYRTVLRGIIAGAHFDGTTPNLYNLFQTVLGNLGLYFVVIDNQNMLVSVIVYGQMDNLMHEIIEHGLIVPRPEGVAVNINATANKVFAWGVNNEVFSGWGTGYWLKQGGS